MRVSSENNCIELYSTFRQIIDHQTCSDLKSKSNFKQSRRLRHEKKTVDTIVRSIICLLKNKY